MEDTSGKSHVFIEDESYILRDRVPGDRAEYSRLYREKKEIRLIWGSGNLK